MRAHRAALESVYRLSAEQRRVLTDIERCRTAALGGHLDQCDACGYEHPSYNSCRNRHCPKCQALAQEQWIEAQRARMLDVPHFHVVFTLPSELRPLAAFARRVVFRALFRAAAATLTEFAHRRGVTIGASLVLHTWTRKLEFHPHVHAIVTGGGLSLDGARWIASHPSFLFPIKAMSRVFRAKMLALLRGAYREERFAGFKDFQDPEAFSRLTGALAKVDWYAYAKPPFERGMYVLEYLGRYTHRVGLANSRLLEVTPNAVTFRTKGSGSTTVDPVTLLRRFVQHVLPSGFHKIRHVGLYASRPRRELARAILGAPVRLHRRTSWRDHLRMLTGRDPAVCPVCGGPLHILPLPRARAPPARAA
ncbi:MAG: IS91 family transposase [Myxococcota bacterium]|nr:IS91 family transposase [Myxococcota bacterium]